MREIKLRFLFRRKFNRTNAPGTCLWCGQKLRRKSEPRRVPVTEERAIELQQKRKDIQAEIFHAAQHHLEKERKELERDLKRLPFPTQHTSTKEWSITEYIPGRDFGDYQDNAFCGLRCGYSFGVAMASQGGRLHKYSGNGREEQ